MGPGEPGNATRGMGPGKLGNETWGTGERDPGNRGMEPREWELGNGEQGNRTRGEGIWGRNQINIVCNEKLPNY